MKLNLNNKLTIGTESQRKNHKPNFTVYQITRSRDRFISFCLYILHSTNHPQDFLVLDESTDAVYRLIDIAAALHL